MINLEKLKTKNKNLQVLNNYAVKNGVMYKTDLNIWLCTATTLPDGLYKKIGKEYILIDNLDHYPEIPDATEKQYIGSLLLTQAEQDMLQDCICTDPSRDVYNQIAIINNSIMSSDGCQAYFVNVNIDLNISFNSFFSYVKKITDYQVYKTDNWLIFSTPDGDIYTKYFSKFAQLVNLKNMIKNYQAYKYFEFDIESIKQILVDLKPYYTKNKNTIKIDVDTGIFSSTFENYTKDVKYRFNIIEQQAEKTENIYFCMPIFIKDTPDNIALFNANFLWSIINLSESLSQKTIKLAYKSNRDACYVSF